MSTLVNLFCDSSSFRGFEKVFDGFSAFEKVLAWAKKIPDSKIVIFFFQNQKEEVENQTSGENVTLFCQENWSPFSLLNFLYDFAQKFECEDVIFSFADLPFINLSLTNEIFLRHKKFAAEYSFADGYPYGFSPEIFAKDSLKILAGLAQKNPDFTKEKNISRTALFDILKTEINSFEIETILCPEDFRMLRLQFDCRSKSDFFSCQNLFKIAQNEENPVNLSKLAQKSLQVRKTFPSYYSIQIAKNHKNKIFYLPKLEFNSEKDFMPFEDFSVLCKKISQFSEEAVISLSFWGEPLEHPYFEKFVQEILKYSGLSVLIETDSLSLTEEKIKNLKLIEENAQNRMNNYPKIMWIIKIDAFSAQKYSEIRGEKIEDFEKALQNVKILSSYFENVYPEMTRINQNEDELESFYRFWSEKQSPSNSKVLVQKYNDFCKTLPDLRPADISPLERNVCWHLLKDFDIFLDGSVPVCSQVYKSDEKNLILGNVFIDDLENIWQKKNQFVENQINENYSQKCRDCDEFYTFNF